MLRRGRLPLFQFGVEDAALVFRCIGPVSYTHLFPQGGFIRHQVALYEPQFVDSVPPFGF